MKDGNLCLRLTVSLQSRKSQCAEYIPPPAAAAAAAVTAAPATELAAVPATVLAAEGEADFQVVIESENAPKSPLEAGSTVHWTATS